MQTMHLILGMSGMKALVTVGAISEFAGRNRNELFTYRRDRSAGVSGLYR